MSFGLFHDGNISVTGGTHGDENAAWRSISPSTKTPTSALTFSYRPTYVAYRRATDLNYFGNTIVWDSPQTRPASPGTTFDMYVSRTDYQGLTQNTQDQAVAFVPRTTLTQGPSRSPARTAPGTAASWTGSSERAPSATRISRTTRRRPCSTVRVNVPDPVDFNDPSSFGGRIAWRGEISPETPWASPWTPRQFGYDYELTPAWWSIRGLVGTSRVGELWTLEYAVGASPGDHGGDSISAFRSMRRSNTRVGEPSTFSAGADRCSRRARASAARRKIAASGSLSARSVANGLSGSVLGGYWQRSELAFASSTVTAGDSRVVQRERLFGLEFNRLRRAQRRLRVHRPERPQRRPESLDTHYSSYGTLSPLAIRGRLECRSWTNARKRSSSSMWRGAVDGGSSFPPPRARGERFPRTLAPEDLPGVDHDSRHAPEHPEDIVHTTVTTRVEERIRSLKIQVKSRRYLEQVVTELGMAPRTRARAARARVRPAVFEAWISTGTSRACRGSTSRSDNGDAKRAADIANRLAELFIEQNSALREAQAKGTVETVEGWLEKTENELRKRDAELARYRALNLYELPDQQAATLQLLNASPGADPAIDERHPDAIGAARDRTRRGQECGGRMPARSERRRATIRTCGRTRRCSASSRTCCPTTRKRNPLVKRKREPDRAVRRKIIPA
jgi:hypothetical protein